MKTRSIRTAAVFGLAAGLAALAGCKSGAPKPRDEQVTRSLASSFGFSGRRLAIDLGQTGPVRLRASYSRLDGPYLMIVEEPNRVQAIDRNDLMPAWVYDGLPGDPDVRPHVVGQFAPAPPPVSPTLGFARAGGPPSQLKGHDRLALPRMRQEQRQGLVAPVGAEVPQIGTREGDPDQGRAEPPRRHDLEGEETERGGYGGGHVWLRGGRGSGGCGQPTFLAFSMASARLSRSGVHLS